MFAAEISKHLDVAIFTTHLLRLPERIQENGLRMTFACCWCAYIGPKVWMG